MLTCNRPPEWVSATPKRFAWTLGLGMTFAMAIITNIGIRGLLPRTICLICLTLMWMESALGLYLGCKIYGLMIRRGWAPTDPAIEVCADGACAQPARTPAPALGVPTRRRFSVGPQRPVEACERLALQRRQPLVVTVDGEGAAEEECEDAPAKQLIAGD